MEKGETSRRLLLTESNYVTWLTLMEAELRNIGCWNKTRLSFVGNKIGSHQRGNGGTSLERNMLAQGIALDQFLELKFKNNEQWVSNLRATTRKIELTGTPVDNALVSRLAICTLPKKYESLI
ncbi:hypothetical protein PPACK8108_LOCUS7770 [Phakopsora pachyrhizi]|uniref:DUF4219 domain-containing protein n=1 Tax=Phakopsora pachyrhizi TaxID=170000 RepID=A0AAV0ATL0_PHAPC|nr:hypothetical protein PPACK8108_LOCUS7770 [Phakopsora pachyrhizi]